MPDDQSSNRDAPDAGPGVVSGTPPLPPYRFLTVDRVEATAVLTIDNPPVNALHPDVADEIRSCAKRIEADRSFRSLVLTGVGRCFVGGGDIRYMKGIDRRGAQRMALGVQRMQQTLFDLRVPVIACLNGHALGGGCELMMSCDIVVAEEQALIGVTEVTLGLIPGAGGTQMLVHSMAVGTAKRLLFTGERISASDAQRYGIVDQVAPSGDGLQAALAVTRRINSAGPLAVEAAKRSANFALRHSLDQGHLREVAIFSGLFDTNDYREGIAAFLERRRPMFEAT